MNLHLFLDVVAWIWGVFFTVVFVCVTIDRGNKQGNCSQLRWIIFFILATLCWAWIVAG